MVSEWYRRGVEDAIAEFDTDPDAGLTEAEAADRLAEYGPNRI